MQDNNTIKKYKKEKDKENKNWRTLKKPPDCSE